MNGKMAAGYFDTIGGDGTAVAQLNWYIASNSMAREYIRLNTVIFSAIV
jgi:hypothetical protein